MKTFGEGGGQKNFAFREEGREREGVQTFLICSNPQEGERGGPKWGLLLRRKRNRVGSARGEEENERYNGAKGGKKRKEKGKFRLDIPRCTTAGRGGGGDWGYER